MKQLFRPKGLLAIALAFTIVLSVVAGMFVFRAATASHAASASIIPHGEAVTAKYSMQAYQPTKNVVFTCQNALAPVVCYGPWQIRQAYDIARLGAAGINGAGTTIVIIDAFQSPTIVRDLHLFDATFHLQNPTLNIIAPDGLTPFNPHSANEVSWSAEISLDVEYAHAIAPAATIDLVLAKNNTDAAILSVTKYAIDNNLGQVISQSFGEAEFCMDPGLKNLQHLAFQEAASKGITVFASSGDTGAAQPNCNGASLLLSTSTPASDPGVIAVGGTHLYANAGIGTYLGETAWNESDVVSGATGGGFSKDFSRPAYQIGWNPNSAARGVPDVAYNASVNGGVLVAWGVPLGVGNFFIFGGTSAGSPQWAGMLALVDSVFGPQGDIHTILYQGFAKSNYALYFHDITIGNNSFGGVTGYVCSHNWDPVTGLGSFDLANTILGPVSASASVKSGPHVWKNS